MTPIAVVVAHEKEPLARVRREVWRAEKRAKSAGRNAFALTLLKRSGGPVYLTAPWFLAQSEPLSASPIGRLIELRELFATPGFSRRALYHVLDWLHRLPAVEACGDEAVYRELIRVNLVHQMQQQASDALKGRAKQQAEGLIEMAIAVQERTKQPLATLIEQFLTTAEFLSRPVRAMRELEQQEENAQQRQAAE